jgi:hypothetical protein
LVAQFFIGKSSCKLHLKLSDKMSFASVIFLVAATYFSSPTCCQIYSHIAPKVVIIHNYFFLLMSTFGCEADSMLVMYFALCVSFGLQVMTSLSFHSQRLSACCHKHQRFGTNQELFTSVGPRQMVVSGAIFIQF